MAFDWRLVVAVDHCRPADTRIHNVSLCTEKVANEERCRPDTQRRAGIPLLRTPQVRVKCGRYAANQAFALSEALLVNEQFETASCAWSPNYHFGLHLCGPN